MAVLHLEVPEELARRLGELAEADKLAVEEKTVRILKDVVLKSQTASPTSRPRTQREVLDDIIRHRVTLPPGTPDSVEMIREDRER